MAVRIVGIGASAGGLRALESFFAEMPADVDAAFVVVQHLSPHYDSSMAAILQRNTRLRVLTLDRELPIEAGTIYVKAPDWEADYDGVLRVRPREVHPKIPYLPIDDFFFALADVLADAAIGIVLSGMGTDGSRGLKEIKEAGGLVMVQEPDSAQFDGMPQAAIVQRIADVVLPPPELASRLQSILRMDHGRAGSNKLDTELADSDQLERLLSKIQDSGRIDFRQYRQPTILRRLEKRMLINQFTDLGAYVDYALEHPAELRDLQQGFLIGVTRFFRDSEAFEIIRQQVLPELFPTDGDPLPARRIWVPACSTGEEVYTLAILIEEYLRAHGLDTEYKIFGSDVDHKAITAASHGKFSSNIAADVPAPYLQKYFQVRGHEGFAINKEIKDRVLFAIQNLLADPPFIRIDLISCRNFLIYIKGNMQQRVLGNFHFALNRQGVLMLGPSESLGSLQSVFGPIDRRWKVFRKVDGDDGALTARRLPFVASVLNNNRPPPPPTRKSTPAPTGEEKKAATATTKSPVSTPYNILARRTNGMDVYARYLSERYAPATIFVNRNYEIVYLNGEFDGILRLPRFDARLNLHSLLHDGAESLVVSGVDRAFTTNQPGRYERLDLVSSNGKKNTLSVRFNPVELSELDEALVAVEFASPAGQGASVTADGEEEVYSIDTRLRDRIRELEGELSRSQQRAQKLYNELDATNEELQASNRELLASNEELQSTNEELQSVNEELYTVNTEFQRKNDELNRSNNDINNLLENIQVSVIFVDKELRIRRFTPGVSQQFDLHTGDLGRPITAFSNPFPDFDIEVRCQHSIQTGEQLEREMRHRNGRYFFVRVFPYLTAEDAIEGSIITFVDIDDLVTTRQQLAVMALRYQAIFDHSQEAIAVVQENGRIDLINQSLGKHKPKDLLGSYFSDLLSEDQHKVGFAQALREVVDNGQSGKVSVVITLGEEGRTLPAELELIPVVPPSDPNGVGGLTPANGASEEDQSPADRHQAMVIVHDTSQLRVAQQQSIAVLDQYQQLLEKFSHDAGLIDMDYQVVRVNHMPSYTDHNRHFQDRPLADFVTESGMKKFVRAFQRIRDGSPAEEVNYLNSELLEEDRNLHVVYRPVLVEGKLVYLTFEIIS